MINGYRLIGICVTCMEDETCRNFLQAMQQNALESHARLLVFNSFLDFYHQNEYEAGARSVYELINYDMLDALVIISQRFHDKQLVQQIANSAKAHQVPTVMMCGEYDGCFVVTRDYSTCFAELISHVLDVHKPATIRYIAGNRDLSHTTKRLDVFRRVMAEHDRDVPESMIAYCDDWTGPVVEAIDAWVAAGEVPEAIICASDVMACAACDQLEKHGLRVPQDVIVTGFDGLSSLTLHSPRLTTCVEDMSATAHQIFDMISDAIDRHAAPYTVPEHYLFHLSESCGCCQEPDTDSRRRAQMLFRHLDEQFHHEQDVFSNADHMLRDTDNDARIETLRRSLLPGSVLVLHQDLVYHPEDFVVPDQPSPMSAAKMVALSSVYGPGSGKATRRITIPELYPNLPEMLHEPAMFVFQAIHVGSHVCGYYAVMAEDIQLQAHKIRRLYRVMNLELSVFISRIHQEQIALRMNRLQSLDQSTGMLNLKGLSAHMNDHYATLSKLCIAVSIYVIHDYQTILENNGLEYAEELAIETANLLRLSNPGNVQLARISPSDFLVVNLEDTPAQISQAITSATELFFARLETSNNARAQGAPRLEINCGCVVSLPGWENNLSSFIKAANGEMYLNRMKTAIKDTTDPTSNQVDNQLLFQLLLDKNLFHYHFQPIVDAHTGDICAYEALMRTTDPVHMPPAQVLDIAAKQQRLYEIEYATLFNVMSYVDNNTDLFGNKRVFINTIPGYFLNEQDRARLTEQFSHLFARFTIEITETGDTDDAELMQIRRLEHNGTTCQLAIDDYGTGFSNIVNLLRYQPQVIKIDRFLVADVHQDSNKQLFIRNTVEFARMNNILVLAEGVETRAELSKVIELGVDLVQGFYLSRPSAQVARELPEHIRHFIIEETLRFSRFGVQQKIYHAKSGDRLDLLKLAVDKYTSIELGDGPCTVVGQRDHFINIAIATLPGANTQLTLENVYISASCPAIALGTGSNVRLTLCGDNAFDQEGILVPSGASLTLCGSGDLRITSIQKKGTVLGSSPTSAFGHICVDMTGKLDLHAESETSICIGGGRSGNDQPIELIRGTFALVAKGIHSVAVGCLDGEVSVVMGPEANVSATVVGNEAVAVGTLNGHVDIRNDAQIIMAIDGERVAGMGVLNNGNGKIALGGPLTRFVIHGAHSVCAGSLRGEVDVRTSAEMLSMYMEGASACGLGSPRGGTTTVHGGCITGEILSSDPLYLGSRTIINSGSIVIVGDNSKGCIRAENAFDQPLVPVTFMNRDEFTAIVGEDGQHYTYRAARHDTMDRLCVYLPKKDADKFRE